MVVCRIGFVKYGDGKIEKTYPYRVVLFQLVMRRRHTLILLYGLSNNDTLRKVPYHFS